MVKNIAIIGGDLRNVNLAKMFAKDGIEVYTYGMEKAKDINKNITICANIDEIIAKNQIIIGPIPLSKNKQELHMPFCEKSIEIKKICDKISSKKVFISGNIDEQYVTMLEEKGVKVIDLFQREELAILNAISTAEAAISIAVQETLSTLHNTNILVMGFGKIGKILSKMLQRNWCKCIL